MTSFREKNTQFNNTEIKQFVFYNKNKLQVLGCEEGTQVTVQVK